MSNYGPNVTKLILRFSAREAVPKGGGMANVLEFFTNQSLRKEIMDKAEVKAMEVIRAVKAAPDNPYGIDDEIIAGVLLEKISEKERKP
jgi:hypothetical protein